jgi:metallo-beta-lactamase class B
MEQVMSVKLFLPLTLVAAAMTGCATPDPTPQAIRKTFEPIKQACGRRDGWSDPSPPSHVFANVYMVGTCGIVSLLITTPEGHFLIDGATAEAAAGIADNIRKLGFDPKDVRYLLATHEHLDHVGGIAELKRITGAKFVTRLAAVAAMTSGLPQSDDPQHDIHLAFEGFKTDMIIEDGDTLRIGKQALTMIATSGHTPGGTSWTWKSCEGKICRQIVYADSLNAVSADTYRFTDHPAYVATLRATIARISGLKECDILISPHPFQSNFFARLAGEAPLVDPHGCANYAGGALDRLNARLAKEAAQ